MHLFETTGERVLVIGARGVLGLLTAQVFQGAGWEVIRGGRSADRTGDWRRIDLDREWTIRPALAGVDVVVNTVPHAGLAAEHFVLENGGLLLTDAEARLESQPEAVGTVVLGGVRTISSTGDAAAAAHATLAIAHALQDTRARGELRPGVFAPESLVDLAELRRYLEAGGIRIEDDPH